MNGFRSARRAAVLVVVALVLGACGGGGGVGGVGGNKVSAQAYVKTACTSFGRWISEIQARVSQISKENPSTPQAGKKAITDFFDGVIADTGTLVDQLKSAGTPDVDNGDQIENALVATLTQVKSLLEQARERVGNLPIDSPQAFVQATGQMSKAIQKAFQRAGQQFGNLRSPQLEQAAAKEPACKSIGT